VLRLPHGRQQRRIRQVLLRGDVAKDERQRAGCEDRDSHEHVPPGRELEAAQPQMRDRGDLGQVKPGDRMEIRGETDQEEVARKERSSAQAEKREKQERCQS
jgi:hypothetical protein